MDGDPLSAFHGGESSSSRCRSLLLLSPPTATEELPNFDAMFSGVSLRSLLLDNPVSPSPSLFSSSSCSSSSSSPLWSPLPSPVSRYSPSPEQQPQLSFHYSPSPLKMPKQEPSYCFPDFAPGSSPFNSLSLPDDSAFCFPLHRFSDLLLSLEAQQPQPPQPPPPPPAAAAGPAQARKRPPPDPERKKRTTEKRKKISHCMRQLHDLVMPHEGKKMDTLTTLEAACKQVACLQQLVKNALQLLPIESPLPAPYFPPHFPTDDDVGGGMLGRSSIQHLLVNSPLGQPGLCSQEYGAAATNQQSLLLKRQQQQEEEAAWAMRMEMQQQMWLNLAAPPNQSPASKKRASAMME